MGGLEITSMPLKKNRAGELGRPVMPETGPGASWPRRGSKIEEGVLTRRGATRPGGEGYEKESRKTTD